MPDSMLQNQQAKYIRARENPLFDGLIRGNASMVNRKSVFDFMGTNRKQKMNRSSSVIDHKEYTSDIKGSHIDIISESVDSSSSMRENNIQSDRDVEKPFRKQLSFPPCAASFYYCNLPQIDDVVESCQSIQKLNMYLKASKDAVNAGVPGRFLRAVLGDISDAGSFISVIMYSLYLHEVDTTSQFCTVPIINLKRVDIHSHGELIWLLRSCNIDQQSLLFVDEAFKDSIVEVFNSQKGSICALIAEKFASISPGILAGKCVSRLLLAGILLDTENLTSPQCTSVDRYMSTLLLNGAGRYGCNGLYHILRSKMQDISWLSVGQILQKDFKKWTSTGKTDIGESRLVVGMSAVGISISQLLSHNETSIQEIILFAQLEKLSLLVILSSYNHHDNFKEMMMYAEAEDIMKELLCFLDIHATDLRLRALNKPGLGDEMRAFTVDGVPSRKTMEQLLQDFCTS